MRTPSLLNQVSLFGLILVVGLASGCSSLSLMGKNKVPTNPANNSDMYRVEMHFHHGDSKTFDGYLNSDSPAGPVTVQTALESSGAVDKYKRMEITLYRRVAETGRMLKMPVVYQPRSDSVKVEQDYALHPGDRIVIKPVARGLFSLVMDGMSDKGFD